MKIQKRHIALASLVVALGAAVYLNWQFSDSTSLLEAGSEVKELGQAKYVNTSVTVPSQDASEATSEAAAEVDSDAKSYFAQQLTKRQQTQDSVLESIEETIEKVDSSDDAKKLAVENLEKLQEMILAQENIEGILKAKGFSECICYLSGESCTVTVIGDELEKLSPLIIKDAVMSQYSIEPENITIIEI